MSTWSQLNLQDAFSPVIEEFIYFHDFTNIVLLFILRFVTRRRVLIPDRILIILVKLLAYFC